ncbi:MAG: hypothetical protein DI534_11100 [Leifsonia xyli]|jgi:hypothetical protein|nr:MAG: hypothetical protein DI534_11100 [Leifsonia xyli]
MAVHFETTKPQALLDAFDDRLKATEVWRVIDFWEKCEDGVSYTHASDEWRSKALLRPVISENRLTFNIVKPQDQSGSATVYAHYHGQIVEAFLRQLDLHFSSIESTPHCVEGDEWA